ncbi:MULTISPECIES: holin family protein [Halocynthiibacter]|uniref:Holin family protein n=1 Tax=Halocynthiibacter halioticoli TaxID=2986804 RepID=A0AAE3J0A0_9RHOB|nr:MULTISPECIES: holin family protein [Halocynthiibacter]MCV6824166.1 holin family protein [Halocynthiibacter halioticoli]MCW4057167.1 holin family protein [Halocynthiibacter sp. SDUM655004]MDE0589803.1 holin family protein [Halocynthiibacter sp. C4]
MGLIHGLLYLLFGEGRNVLRETSEVFRENTEEAAKRAVTLRGEALGQLAAEFALPRKGRFDRFMDGLNRLPRPALVFGILALFVSAMVDPVWFASRMQGLLLVPEPLWWLLGIVVSFYFGARHQAKSQEFQRSLSQTMQRVPDVMGNLDGLREIGRDAEVAARRPAAKMPEPNGALVQWQRAKSG